MLLIFGFILVLVSVVGGYIIAGGNVFMLVQPAEYLIIVGATVGAFVAGHTKYSLGLTMKSMKRALGDPGMSKERYIETLALLNTLFSKMHREGVISIEGDIEKPESSTIFGKYPNISKNTAVVHFIGDTLRVYLTTGDPADIENLMNVDMNVTHEEDELPAQNISHTAESLPGMGIVACVLGVTLTMAKINAPPEELGHAIGAALIGTFVGILFCYGFVGPIASKLEAYAKEEHFYYNSIKEAVAAVIRGSTPIIAVEYGRRAIPHKFRPSFLEMEDRLRNG